MLVYFNHLEESEVKVLSYYRAVTSPIFAALGVLVNLFCIGRIVNVKAEGSAVRTNSMAMMVYSTNLVFIALDHLAFQVVLKDVLSHQNFCFVTLLLKSTTLNVETWLIIGIYFTILDRLQKGILIGLMLLSTLFNVMVESLISTHVIDEQEVLICVRSEGIFPLAIRAVILDLIPLGFIFIGLMRILAFVCCKLELESCVILIIMTALAILSFFMHLPFWLLDMGIVDNGIKLQDSIAAEAHFDWLDKIMSWILVPIIVLRMQVWSAKLATAYDTEIDLQVIMVELEDLEPPTFSQNREDSVSSGCEL